MTLTPLLNTPILASSIPLNDEEIHYLVYEGDCTAVWDLRRKIVEKDEILRKDFLSSTLWTVQVISQSIHRLWLFYIGAPTGLIHDDRVVKTAESTITPRNLYPCSEECSHQTSPCSNCRSSANNSVPTSAKYLPRRPWRRPWTAFLDAARAALIRSVTRNNVDSDSQQYWASALENGFLVATLTSLSNAEEWVTSGWEQVNPLLYVNVQVQPALEPTPRLVMHATITRTPYYPLGSTPAAGTALILLPYATPAYFIAKYTGPTSALTSQFREALCGIGVDGWEDPDFPRKNGKGKSKESDSNGGRVRYVIVYVPVHAPGNGSGISERKGLTIIYPSRLALALPSNVRAPMDASLLPILPAPLQPSPMVPAAIVHPPMANGAINLNSPITGPGPRPTYQLQFPSAAPVTSTTTNVFPTLNSPIGYAQPSALGAGPGGLFPLPPSSTISSASFNSSLTSGLSNPSNLNYISSLSNATLLRAHRAVSTTSRLSAQNSPSLATSPAAPTPGPGAPTPGTVGAPTPTPGGPGNQALASGLGLIPGSTTSSSALNQTVVEVSAYVDYVAKEREKERERLREAQKGRTVSGSGSTSAAVNSARSVPPISIPSGPLPSSSSALNIGLGMGAGNIPNPPPASAHAGIGPVAEAQLFNFYPSPPTNPPSVSAAGVGGGAMSPVVVQGPAPLPQIPQGLPSMHDTDKRVALGGIGSAMEVSPITETATSVLPPSITYSVENDTTTAPTDAPLDQPRALHASSSISAPAVVPEVPPSIPSPQARAGSVANSANDPNSSWGYFGGDMNLDELGMLDGISGMSMNLDVNGGNGVMEAGMDMDLGLFGIGGDTGESNSFNLDNLTDLGWSMNIETFGFGSGSTQAAPIPASGSGSGQSIAATAFGQQIPPPMILDVTAPAQRNTSATFQTSGSGSESGLGIGLGIGMDFEADFTDDDFSFFDHKSNQPQLTNSMIPPPPPASVPSIVNPSDGTAAISDPLAFLNGEDTSSFFSSLGLAPPLPIGSGSVATPATYPSHPTPHSMSHPTPGGVLGGGFNTLTVDVEVEMEMDPGLPSPPAEENDHVYNLGVEREQGSPLASPFRPSLSRSSRLSLRFPGGGSLTPTVQLKDKRFAPIPFARSHSVADGKYRVAGGKFALLRSTSGWLQHKRLFRPPYVTLRVDGGRRASWSAAHLRGMLETETESGATQDTLNVNDEDQKMDMEQPQEEGKWSLPSPPMDSEDTDSSSDDDGNEKGVPLLEVGIALPPPTSSPSLPSTSTKLTSRRGWRPRYDRVTDPRFGVVRKLAGFKHKQKSKNVLKIKDKRPRWMKDWERETGRHVDGDDRNGVQSENDSDVEEDEEDEEGTATEKGGDVGSEAGDEEMAEAFEGKRFKGAVQRDRPATPLPAYVPPGPNLVATCFHWVHLVGLAGGERMTQTSTSEASDFYQPRAPLYDGGIHSVPTPVSPGAYIGTSTSASPAFAMSPGQTWNQALTPSADIDSTQDEEKARILEATASIAQECVENPVWLDVWNAVERLIGGGIDLSKNSEESGIGTMNARWSMDGSVDHIGLDDIRAVKQLLAGSRGLSDHLLNIEDLFEAWSSLPTAPVTTPKTVSSVQPGQSSSSVAPLSPPLFSVAKSEVIIHIMPTALRFWDKLGLAPKSGQKNVTVFVLRERGSLESEPDEDGNIGKVDQWREEQIELWLKNTVELYKSKRLGEMTPGKSSFCQKDGLVSFPFGSSFRKNLAAFIGSLPLSTDKFVFFVLIPLSLMTHGSKILRYLFSAIKKVLQTYCEAQIFFQFVPEPHILNAAVHPSSPHDFCSESFLGSVYNRILIPVDRAMAHGKRVRKFFEMPEFTLARPLNMNKVSYSYSTNPSLDVLERHTFLHVGYQLSSCGRWILAACIDQRGEAHDLGIWSARPYHSMDKKDGESPVSGSVVSDEMYVVNKVWDFAMQFAERANVEWRVVFAKSGTMGVVELDAWITHLSTVLYSTSKSARAPMHVSLLSTEHSTPLIILPTPPQTFDDLAQRSNSPFKGSSLSRSVSGPMKASSKSQLFVDTSMTTYSLLQKYPLPMGFPPTLNDLGLASDLVMETTPPAESDDDPQTETLSLRPLISSALVRMPTPHSLSAPTLPQMINMHLLYAAKSEGCSYPTLDSGATDSPQSLQYLLHDITNSFYSLSVLSAARWGMAGVSSLLPFHLGAVETMRKALATHGCP